MEIENIYDLEESFVGRTLREESFLYADQSIAQTNHGNSTDTFEEPNQLEQSPKIKMDLGSEDQNLTVNQKTPFFSKLVDDRNQGNIQRVITKNEEPKPLKTKQIKRNVKKLLHLIGKRRPKGEKNKLQDSVNGYWTKNLLPFAKNHHIKFIVSIFGPRTLEMFQQLKEINDKNGITMEDYEKLYSIAGLENAWIDFFSRKILYRELMISRTEPHYKLIYVRFLHKFEDAFRMRKFIGISRKIQESEDSHSRHDNLA